MNILVVLKDQVAILYGGPGQVYLENGHYGTSWEQQPGGLSQSYGQIIQRNNNAK